MSLTSYRAAPPRVTISGASPRLKQKRRLRDRLESGIFNIANGFLLTPPAKPGDDLLFHCLSSSTIGAVRFHGRVRDGIGWVTDAMVTKLWDRRFEALEIVQLVLLGHLAEIKPDRSAELTMMVGLSSAK